MKEKAEGGGRMKEKKERKNIIAINIRTAKHLRKASPAYFPVKAADAVIGAVSGFVQMLFYQKLIDSVIYTNPPLVQVAVWLLLLYAFGLAARTFQYWVAYHFHEREKVKIGQYYKELVYSEVVKKNLCHHDAEQYLDMLYNAVYNDGVCLLAFAENLCGLLSSVLVFASIAYLFGRLHIIFVVGAIFSAVKNCICSSRVNKIKYQIHKGDLAFDRCDTYIGNLFYEKRYIRELKLYPIGDYFAEKYKLLRELRWKNDKKPIMKRNVVELAKETLDSFFYVFNITFLVYLLVHHRITVGEFSMVLSNFALLTAHIEGILMFFPRICDNADYVRDIFKVLDEEDYHFPDVSHEPGTAHCGESAYVKCENLCFSYSGETKVLKGIDIELPLDKKIAIVGENGSGKSTLLKLLLGLYMPSEGKVEYYFPDMSVKNSMELFSAMLQDCRIFPLSVRENIDPEGRGCEEALCFAGLTKKVEGLRDGLDTVLGEEALEGGSGLSGGERQSLAIARTYAKASPVLVFDEPSANLDPAAEKVLIEKINRLADGRGVIMATHRLAYTRDADIVCVIEGGKVVEFGSPKELVEKKGRYEEMLRQEREQGGGAC